MAEPIILGVAARDRKARSKPMSQILNRILANKELNCQIINFGDKVLLDEPPSSWPVVDVLISFFSEGLDLDKVIEYVDLRKPVLVNDLRFQKVLWDRRAVLAVLDACGVPTPHRIECDRDEGPCKVIEPQVAEDAKKRLGVDLLKKRERKECRLKPGDEDVLLVGDEEIRKPFVEKPVSGEDHNIHIYFPKSRGGGGRRLFRKVGNKSSEYDPSMTHPRTEGSYIYEQFMDVDNAEDVKVYTIGPYFTHAETRKSPVVDGLVKRNPDGKEIRYITKLSEEEIKMATSISKAFKQNICGFDLLRVGKKSYVIDVNGWSFVKGNEFYYEKCAEILSKFCKTSVPRRTISGFTSGALTPEQSSWQLKANVTVFRHGDRTPKQKLKRSFKPKDAWAAPIIALLQGHREEIILRDNLDIVSKAAQEALQLPGANKEDLDLVIQVIERKKGFPGTKVQMKPSFSKDEDSKLEKMQLIIKWGGEFSHAARHQAKDFGQNMRRDMNIMNDAALRNTTIYTSSERRVTASAEIFAAAFLDDPENPRTEPLQLVIRKDLLDDSNAAKDEMETVKKQLKASLKPDTMQAQVMPDGWPEDLPSPVALCQRISETLQSLSKTMRDNYAKLDVESIQHRWCTHETPSLFRERWEKLFADYADDPYDPSRTSELFDMLSHDGLHNRPFTETIFSNAQDPPERKLDRLHELYRMALAMFLHTCPKEYGITPQQKERIGLLTSMPLLQNICADLQASQEGPLCSLYFTKESHIHTLLNLVLASDLPIVMERVPALDYFSSITFEVFEKIAAPGTASATHSPRPSTAGSEFATSLTGAASSTRSSSPTAASTKTAVGERSLLISVSEGAHSTAVFSINLGAQHALSPLPRRPLTTHMDFDTALAKLNAHSHADVSTSRQQIEGASVYFGVQDEGDRVILPVRTRRLSGDTDRTSIRG